VPKLYPYVAHRNKYLANFDQMLTLGRTFYAGIAYFSQEQMFSNKRRRQPYFYHNYANKIEPTDLVRCVDHRVRRTRVRTRSRDVWQHRRSKMAAIEWQKYFYGVDIKAAAL